MAHVCASDSRSCSTAAVAFTVTLVPSSTSGQQPDSGMRSPGDPRPPAASDAGLRAGQSGPWPVSCPWLSPPHPRAPSPGCSLHLKTKLSVGGQAGSGRDGWDRACSGDHVGAGLGGPHPLELGGTALRQRTHTWAALAVPVGLASVRRPGGRVPGPSPAHGHRTRLSAGNTRQGPADPSAGQATSGPSPRGSDAPRRPVRETSPWGRLGSHPVPRDPACPPPFYPCP